MLRRSAIAAFAIFAGLAGAGQLDLDVEVLGKLVGQRAVAAERYCSDFVGRDGRCTRTSNDVRSARLAMVAAGIAIDDFYLKCHEILRRSQQICDSLITAHLVDARSKARD